MSIDTPLKRSTAFRFGRGPTTRPPQSSSTAFVRASGLGYYFIVSAESPPTYTTRLVLIGASQQRFSLEGASNEMLILEGVSVSRLSLVGSSP